MIDLTGLQNAVGAWATRNFPCESSRAALRCTLGVCEEAGELAHAVLKREQGIRGMAEDHAAAMKDAIGDIVVYLMDLCHREKWNIEEIISDVVVLVTNRNWIANPVTGGEEEDG